MGRNIKEIGKELLGKSLNNFHRKTGLTQLEENNKMQDGILDGVLSQVDDAYITKTEQSNVIHLEGSGDGVVVLDSIEGNTMVNCSLDFNEYIMYANPDNPNAHLRVSVNKNKFLYKPNTVYTIFIDVVKNTIQGYNKITPIDNYNCVYTQYLRIQQGQTGKFKLKIQTRTQEEMDKYSQGFNTLIYTPNGEEISGELIVKNIFILEGDWTNKELPQYFEGLQSSFEEKVNNEGKYEIEILSQNDNFIDMKIDSILNCSIEGDKVITVTPINTTNNPCINFKNFISKGTYYYKGVGSEATQFRNKDRVTISNLGAKKEGRIELSEDVHYITYNWGSNGTTNSFIFDITREIVSRKQVVDFIPHKQNKIKLSINEPLRAINDRKDNICIKDGRLMVERNCIELVYNGTENWEKQSVIDSNCTSFYSPTTDKDIVTLQKILCNILPYKDSTTGGASGGKIFVYTSKNLNVIIEKNKLSSDSVEGFKEYLKTNNLKVVIPLNTPIYEEVLNEHGEPILLEGYENGTIYIDSAIVPTTTVRYTPKMESFKTLKEVKIRNTINDFDVTENVIPYMMEVDMKLTELEISAYSTYNIKNTRKMEVLDMTSMQERTFNMLERLIRGKSHTKQEMIDRVLLYEQAKRITTEQALELNLIIEEVYGA